VVVVLVLSGVFLANCGSSNNVCDQAAEIMMEGMKEACKQQTNCCYCTCIMQGKVPDMTKPDQCVCISGAGGTGGTSGGECTGEVEEGAKECVNDPAACKQAAGQLIPNMCASGGIS